MIFFLFCFAAIISKCFLSVEKVGIISDIIQNQTATISTDITTEVL